MTTTVSFVGLGVMGLPMALNLQAAGFAVTAHTRTAAGRERARERGLTVVERPDLLPEAPDVVVTVLPDAPDVAAVLHEPGGVLDRAGTDTVFVDMSTISPDAARAFARELAERGLDFVDAPVSGGEAGAVAGTLSIMIGGAETAVERVRPLFEAMGSTIVRVGDSGAGQVTKAANQLIVAANLAALGEALVFLEAHDIDARTALGVIAGGLAGSTVIDRKAEAMLTRAFAPGFRLTLHDKDLRIVQAAATEQGLPLELTALVTQRVRSLVATGRGDLDHAALYLAAAEAAGRAD